MSDLGETPVVLYTARELYQAQAVHDALQDAGIPARIEGESLNGVLGGVPFGEGTSPRVMVRLEDESRARILLERLLEEFKDAQAESTSEPLCLSCGANMQNADTCPRCGWSFKE